MSVMDWLPRAELAVVLPTLLAIAASLFAYFIGKLWRARTFFRLLQKRGVPMPPHSFALGHLLFLQKTLKTIPSDLHKMLYFGEILQRDFAKQGIFYMDLWPFSEPFVFIMSPTLATQATQTNDKICMERPPQLDAWFKPLAGGPNLFDLPEKQWKPWRNIFNQGFSNTHTLSLVPGIVTEAHIYRQKLLEQAQKQEMFFLDPTTIRFMMDVMGRTVLNTSLEAQKGYNPLADSMINQISWHLANREADPIQYLNFVRPVMQWYNGRTMDNYVGKELDKRYQEYREDPANLRSKAVIDLVLQAYMADVPSPPEKMDKNFRTFAIRQIRLFVFVGHDSTSSTICYLFHLLNTNPETLARVRAEHDSVFGTDLTALPPLLSKNPHLINQLPYSTAAIKETLRLFPAASTIRQGAPGEDLVDEAGNRYPTENTMMLIVHPTMQRSPSYWPRPDEFIPERWLVEPSHELYPLKAAWRPFEWGPRNCMGQALVMMELKTVLAMIVREFDFTPAYDEFDKAHPKKGPRTYRGDRAYQIEEGAAHPSDHYPCRVSLAQRQKIVRG